MKKLIGALLFSIGLASCDFSESPDYEHQTIVGTSPYSNWKANPEQAMELAEAELEAFAKSECRRAISNGWSLGEVISEGVMNCEKTPEGHHCRKKNVELECRRINEFFP